MIAAWPTLIQSRKIQICNKAIDQISKTANEAPQILRSLNLATQSGEVDN
jgi:hypothetical protein